MDVETSTVEGTTSAGATENDKEPSESAQAKADRTPAEDNDVTMSGVPDSKVMSTPTGSSSHVPPSIASAPGSKLHHLTFLSQALMLFLPILMS